jgi:hypothetical protein
VLPPNCPKFEGYKAARSAVAVRLVAASFGGSRGEAATYFLPSFFVHRSKAKNRNSSEAACSMNTHDDSHRGIEGEAFGIVDIFIPSQATVEGLAEEGRRVSRGHIEGILRIVGLPDE